MSYLLVADFQNYGHEETIFQDKKEALKALEKVKKAGGGQSAFLYKLKLTESWIRGR
jgi:hypothetical protein